MIIAGIGSRTTPLEYLSAMTAIGQEMARDGHILRSGGAAGADSAFEQGWWLNEEERYLGDMELGIIDEEPKRPYSYEIYVPWYGFNKRTKGSINCQTINNYGKASSLAQSFHPAWDRCSRGAKALHTRNVYIMLGHDLETPVDKVYCWTPGAKVTGGTGQALRLALHYGIPIINLARKEDWKNNQYLREYADTQLESFNLSMSRSS